MFKKVEDYILGVSWKGGRMKRGRLWGLIVFVVLAAGCLTPREKRTGPPYESMSTAVAAGNPQQALQERELALAEKPSTFQERLLHARLLTLSGRLAEARGELLGLLKDFPVHPEVLYAFALLEAQKGKGGEQRGLLERALKADGRHSQALATLCYIREEWRRAYELFSQACTYEEEQRFALLAALRLKRQGSEQAGAGADALLLASQFLLLGRVRAAQSYLLEVKGLEKKDLPERRIAVSILEKFGVKDDE